MYSINKLNRVTVTESYLFNGSLNLICDIEYDKEHKFLCAGIANDKHYLIFNNHVEFEKVINNYKNNRIWFKDAANDTMGVTKYLKDFRIYDYEPYVDYMHIKSHINNELRARYKSMDYLYSFFDNNVNVSNKHIYDCNDSLKAIKTLEKDLIIMQSFVYQILLKNYTNSFDLMNSRIIIERNMVIDDRTGKFQFQQFKTKYTSEFTQYVSGKYKTSQAFRISKDDGKVYTKISLKFTILPEIYTRHIRLGRAFLSELAMKDKKYLNWVDSSNIKIDVLIGKDVEVDNIKIEEVESKEQKEINKEQNENNNFYAIIGGRKYIIEFDDVEIPILPLLKPANALISLNNKYVSEFESRNDDKCVFPIHFANIFIDSKHNEAKVMILPGLCLI